jgi:hypothetical protein
VGARTGSEWLGTEEGGIGSEWLGTEVGAIVLGPRSEQRTDILEGRDGLERSLETLNLYVANAAGR